MAALIKPDLIESAATYHVDVDEREGLTRGHTFVDEDDVTDGKARTTVIKSINTAAFHQMFEDMLFESSQEVQQPDRLVRSARENGLNESFPFAADDTDVSS